ncbi:MAG: zinc-binding dehydrogenase [Galactobacter sp.]
METFNCEVTAEPGRGTALSPCSSHESVVARSRARKARIADFAGFGATTTGAIQAVKERGRVVLVGLGASEVPLSSIDLVSRAIDLHGSTVPGDPKQLGAVLKLIGDGQLHVKAETITFDDIPAGLQRLAEGKVNGRLVAVFD